MAAGPSGAQANDLHEGPDGVPVISPPDLIGPLGVDTRRLRRVSKGSADKLARFTVRAGDLLVVRQGSLGRLGLIGPEHAGWLYGSSCLRLRPKGDVILSAYLASYLSLPPVQKELVGLAQPSTVPSLNSAALRQLPIAVPPMDKQQAVTAALADIDEQVVIHQKMASRLLALRPAVFDELIWETKTPWTS